MARMPLTTQQSTILQAAHYAAQEQIEYYVAEMCEERVVFYSENISKAQKRKKILDMLVEHGFGRFLLEYDSSFGGYYIAPYSYTEIRTEEDIRVYKKYSVSEVVAYLDFRGLLATRSAIGYIKEQFNTSGMSGGPGQPFSRGWGHYLSKSGKRIIGNYYAGLDI